MPWIPPLPPPHQKAFAGEMIVLSDPTHLKLCEQGTWNTRMLVETGLLMRTRDGRLFVNFALAVNNAGRSSPMDATGR